MQRAMFWRTRAPTPERCRHTWAIARSRAQCATLNWHRAGSKTCGAETARWPLRSCAGSPLSTDLELCDHGRQLHENNTLLKVANSLADLLHDQATQAAKKDGALLKMR